ncbi:MAG: hypothetical protein WC693_03160 [Patescibacteria group bacterium]|jgi:hypothetical protein
MKKALILSVTLFLLLLPASRPLKATPYLDSYFDEITAGDNCTLVNTPAEADATHVYTLNPDYTKLLAVEYPAFWERQARCDELQFHVDHNTPKARLSSWLLTTAQSWLQNISTSHYKNQTVSTSRDEWFFINESGAHRIPDILTGWSWGLLGEDYLKISPRLTDSFYNSVTIGSPLQFNDGQYAEKIRAIWKNGDRNFDTLPTRLGTSLSGYTYGYPKLFTSCPSSCGSPTDRHCGNLLDWRWFQSNQGYRTCPDQNDLDAWRYGSSETF